VAFGGIITFAVRIRGTTIVFVTIAALLLAIACGGKTERDFTASGTGEPSGSAGDDGVASDAAGGNSAGAALGTGGAANAGAGGSAASRSIGGSSGIDWSLIEWEAVGGSVSVQPNCGLLAAFARSERLTERPAQQALFSDSLDRVVLRVEDAVLVISLPSGQASELAAVGVTSIEWVGEGQQQILATLDSQELLLVPLDGEPSTLLASSVCYHVTTPDRSRAYILSACDWPIGTLSAVDLETGDTEQLAEGVQASVKVSPDGRWVAFRTGAEPPDPCPSDSSNLRVLDQAGELHFSLAHAPWFHPQFLANGLLLAGRALSCEQWELLLYAPEQDALVPLNSGLYPSWHPWQISLELQITLGERFDFEAATTQPGELVAISLTGEGETVLASNLYLYHAEQIAMDYYHAFALTADGQHAVYVSAGSVGPGGLSAVPTSGGTPFSLSASASGYDYALSPTDPDQIVFVERIGDPPNCTYEVRLGSVSTGSSRILYSMEGEWYLSPLPELAFLPDGRGLLLVDDVARLLFVPSAGDPVVLAENVGSFDVDASGCVALYVTGEPETATHLVVIPRDMP
jgi:hypothetical protein